MAQQQSTLRNDDGTEQSGFQLLCCPIQLARSSSEARTALPPTPRAPTPAVVEDKDAPVEDTTPIQLNPTSTTSLQRAVSFARSISLNRKPSRPSAPHCENQPDIDIELQATGDPAVAISC